MELGRCLARGFFFVETQRTIATKFPGLYKRSSFIEIKAGIEQLTKSFGWYLTLKRLAESGIFNRPDMTPLESAENAPLYDAFVYLSAVEAEFEYQNKYNEEQSKKKKK